MPKKKKSSRPSGGADSVQASPTQEEKLVDCMILQAIPSSTSPIKTLQYTPMIILTADDADRLGVAAGDSVLILCVEAKRLHATARALVHISSSSSTPSSATKSPSSGLVKTQRSKLSPGFCHIFPDSLANHLKGLENVALREDMMATPIVPSTSTPTTTPSPSKSKFSFAKGAGYTFVDSHSTPKKEQNFKGSQSRTKDVLWVVPVECDLGDILTECLCSRAQEISLQADSKILRDYPSLGSLLIRAHLSSRFVSVDTYVSISIQGLSTPCLVKNIKEMGGDRLEEKLAQLSLESTLDSESQKLVSVVSCTATIGTHLYQVSNDTVIVTQDADSDGSNACESAETAPPVSLLAGLDDTIENVTNRLLIPLRHPELFQKTNGLRPPKGVLLYGASGSGKSTLAKQVAQFLKYHHNVQVQEIPCSRLQARTALVGQAEQELVRYFESAAKSSVGSASLLVLDDVHLICPRRQGMNVGADRLAATLLALLDGVDSQSLSLGESHHPVMILAATSNPSLLDPALRRPGRLDAEVEVPLPDEPSVRSQIIKFQMKSLNVKVHLSEDSEEWIRLARLAKGFTGADLQLAVKEAVRISFSRSGPTRELSSIGVEGQDIDSAIRSIKPSAIKSVTVEIPQVHWSSIGGMEDVKLRLREAIELPITHGDLFQQLGIRPPRGVLLYGPPGCSKTLMARALATEGCMNFLAVKGPELLSKWLGESERALASLFRRARLASPSIIFFDEVDAIASKRGGGNLGGGERLLSQLLTELDGIQSGNDIETKKRVIVVCATNRPDLLDGALMRPGRLDRMIYVGVPDQESRKKILEIGLRDKACGEELDVSQLATEEVSGGLSGAEIISACRNAALAALEEDENLESLSSGKPSVGMRHMLRALRETERQITPGMIEFYMGFFQGQTSVIA